MLLVPLEYLPHRAGWGRQPLVRRVQSRVGPMQQHHCDIRQRVRGALVELQPTAHAQQVIECDLSALVRLPFRDRDRPVNCDPAVLHQNTDQRIGDRLGHRPSEEGRVRREPLGIALGDDLPIAHDDDGPGAARPLGLGFGKRAIENRAKCVVRRSRAIRGSPSLGRARRSPLRIGCEPDGAATALAIDGFLANHPRDARRDASGSAIDRRADVLQRRQVIDFQLSLDDLRIATRDEHLRAQHLGFVCGEDRRDARSIDTGRREDDQGDHARDRQRAPSTSSFGLRQCVP